MTLDDAAEAYAVYDRREALKIVLHTVAVATIPWGQFEAVDMRVGRVVAVEDFPGGEGRPGS